MRTLLLWLDAQDGEAPLSRAIDVWGLALLQEAIVRGGLISVDRGLPGRPSLVRLTDRGREEVAA